MRKIELINESIDNDPFDQVTQEDLKKAFLRYMKISENEIAPAGKHSHTYNYVPEFKYNPAANILRVKFDFGKTTIAEGAGTYTHVFSCITKERGEFLLDLTIEVAKNNHQNTLVKAKYVIDDEKFKTFNEARNELFKKIGL